MCRVGQPIGNGVGLKHPPILVSSRGDRGWEKAVSTFVWSVEQSQIQEHSIVSKSKTKNKTDTTDLEHLLPELETIQNAGSWFSMGNAFCLRELSRMFPATKRVGN